MTIFEKWQISPDELTALLDENPSLRGMILGYVAESKLKRLIQSIPDVSFITKFDDHNRKKKGDLYIVYKGKAFDIESKSLQSNMIEYDKDHKLWRGKAQVDGSDRRIITLPDKTTLNTTLLLRGEFDILAVNCFAFEGKFNFIFARNKDLPHSSFKKYTKKQQKHLIASLISVSWPPQPPFCSSLKELLDGMIEDGLGQNPKKIK